jgi:hypothetical protein
VTKISQLSSIGDSLAIGDQFLIRDIDDAGSPNKSVTVSGITRALADGNATAPALAFAADKNTGIYRAGTDSLAVATNGTGRLFVDANGNVGLGVLNPTSTANGLDISSGGLSLVVGANNTQTTRTNATTKTSRIASFHYTNTEEPVAMQLQIPRQRLTLYTLAAPLPSAMLQQNLFFTLRQTIQQLRVPNDSESRVQAS